MQLDGRFPSTAVHYADAQQCFGASIPRAAHGLSAEYYDQNLIARLRPDVKHANKTARLPRIEQSKGMQSVITVQCTHSLYVCVNIYNCASTVDSTRLSNCGSSSA